MNQVTEDINNAAGLLTRRRVLGMGIVTAAAAILPINAMASLGNIAVNERRLRIYNLHTKEHMNIVYWKDGNYIKEGLGELTHLFRDHYNGRVHRIDRRLFNLLFHIQKKLNTTEPFHLISGYRTASTNAKLRRHNHKVAKRSMHVKGKAADIRLPGHSISEIRHAAYELKGGGVGYYPKSHFVHVDVGRVRFWRG